MNQPIPIVSCSHWWLRSLEPYEASASCSSRLAAIPQQEIEREFESLMDVSLAIRVRVHAYYFKSSVDCIQEIELHKT